MSKQAECLCGNHQWEHSVWNAWEGNHKAQEAKMREMARSETISSPGDPTSKRWRTQEPEAACEAV